MDRSVLNWIIENRISWLTTVFRAITNVGGLVGLIIATVIVTAALLLARRHRSAILVGGSMLSGWAVMNLLKVVFGRTRPPLPDRLVLESSASFPSGHAMLSAMFATACAAVLIRTMRSGTARTAGIAALAGFALVDGASRVYLGAHWLTDVLAGWLLGVIWAAAWIAMTRVQRPPTRRWTSEAFDCITGRMSS